jgi:hypothetical protein
MFTHVRRSGSLLLLSSLDGFTHWLETHLLQCPFKKQFLIDCPGCGLQRSLVALLRGDISQAWHYYPPTFPMIVLFVFTFLHIRLAVPQGAFIIRLLYITCAIFIIVNYSLKIYNHQLL